MQNFDGSSSLTLSDISAHTDRRLDRHSLIIWTLDADSESVYKYVIARAILVTVLHADSSIF